jgi:molybdopterin biosynthesis enzyme MoaB
MKKTAAVKAKKLIAAGASAVLATSLAVVVTAGGGGHSPRPVTTAGSTWAGLGQSSLLGSIFHLL